MLDLVFWNVQHGSAAFIRTPTEKYIVIDLGVGTYDGMDFSPFQYIHTNMNVKRVDCVIITHPHRDHLEDILNFDNYPPMILKRPIHLNDDVVLKGNREQDREIIDKYLKANSRFIYPVPQNIDPFNSDINGDVLIRSFTPCDCDMSNLNNHSIVTILSYANSKIIIPGDNEPDSWNELFQNSDFLELIKGTDILVAPHHGRESGYSSELFNYIRPKLVIISDGRFGDTSATTRYSQKASGLDIKKRSGGNERRYCVTTRNDGIVMVQFGLDDQGEKIMNVSID